MTTDPDCITGKHRACVNAVWDDETDTLVECACECHSAPSVPEVTP